MCIRDSVYAPTADTAIMCTEVLEDWNPETITYDHQPDVSGVYQMCIRDSYYNAQMVKTAQSAQRKLLRNQFSGLLVYSYSIYELSLIHI